MKSIMTLLFQSILKDEAKVSLLNPLFFKRITFIGTHEDTLNPSINMNIKYLHVTPRENKKIIDSFFHEKSHNKQNMEFLNSDPNFRGIQMAKERLMYEVLVYKENGDFSSENYCKMGLECDANLRGILESIMFFSYVNSEFAKENYNIQKLKFKNFLTNRSNLERMYLRTGQFYDVDYLFDSLYSKEALLLIVSRYPILLYEYHEDGSKKTIYELMTTFNALKNRKERLKNEEHEESEYARLMRIYRELIFKRQKFLVYQGKIINNKLERFNDWKELIDSIHKDVNMDIQIVDYLWQSISSFLNVASETDLKEALNIFQYLNQKLAFFLHVDQTVMEENIYKDVLNRLSDFKNIILENYNFEQVNLGM